MSRHSFTVLLRHIRQLAGAGRDGEQTDRQLLQRFVVNGEEEAFALLMRRHGSMVIGPAI